MVIPIGRTTLHGTLSRPAEAQGIVLFAHGSGSSRFSPRNRFVADVPHGAPLYLPTGEGITLAPRLSPAAERLGGLSQEVAMYHRDEENCPGRSDAQWWQWPSSGAANPVHDPWLRRMGMDPYAVLYNGTETRRFLAQEVYRVPEEWLNEVLRVRLADLMR